MAFWTIFFDTFRHAWRRRVPVILAALLLLGMLVMPQILSGDGSPEGELRIFLLYAGHCALFALSLLGVGYALWSESQECRLGVDQLIATRPLSLTTLLSGRILALLTLMLILAIVDIALLVGVAWNGVHGRYEEKLSGTDLKDRLLKVHEFQSLYYLGEKGDLRDTGQRVKKKIRISPGVFHVWDLPLSKSDEEVQISGQLLSVDTDLQILLDLRVHSGQRGLWRETISVTTGQPFRFSLPEAVKNFPDLHLMIRQINSREEPVIYTSLHPFEVRGPGGSLSSNILRAIFQLSLLWIYLLTLTFIISRFLPPQSSLLPIGLVAIVGCFRSSIHGMLFPVSKIPEELQPPPGIGDVLYMILWKPILFLIPDFSSLNPIPALARGEKIIFNDLGSQIVAIALVLLVATFMTHYYLPRKERLPRR